MPAKDMLKNEVVLTRRFRVPNKQSTIVVQWHKHMTPPFSVWVEDAAIPGERDRQGCASEHQMWALAELVWEKEGGQ